jgi:hypothetical protein
MSARGQRLQASWARTEDNEELALEEDRHQHHRHTERAEQTALVGTAPPNPQLPRQTTDSHTPHAPPRTHHKPHTPKAMMRVSEGAYFWRQLWSKQPNAEGRHTASPYTGARGEGCSEEGLNDVCVRV